MNHIMAPHPGPLSVARRVVRTENTCPCRRCVGRRRTKAALLEKNLKRTGAYELARHPAALAVLDAISAVGA